MLTSTAIGALLLASALNVAAWPLQRFKSTGLVATTLSYKKYGGPIADGYLFLEPVEGPDAARANGPQILTTEGDLVWRLTNEPLNAGANFHKQTYNGQDVLTYWTGDGASNDGFGYGSVILLNQNYTQIQKICLSDLNIVRLPGHYTQDCQLDLHESRITPQNTLLATVRNVTRADMSSVGGPKDGFVLDSVFVEVDIATSKVLLVWSAVAHLDQLDFFSITEMQPGSLAGTSPEHAWDFMHMNSVASTASPQSGYIVSARYLSSAIKLDTKGNVQWYLKGKGNGVGGNFTLPSNAGFAFEHDIVPFDETADSLKISLFDNNNVGGGTEPSSGLVLQIFTKSYTVKYIQRYSPPTEYDSPATGSCQVLSNGNVLVDYGHPAVVNEWSANGTLVYAAQYAESSGYRAYRQGWLGYPITQPSIYANVDRTTTTVYLSWNGATQVARWAISGGSRASNVKPLGASYPRTSFETKITLNKAYDYVVATALDSSGRVLSTTPVKRSVAA